MTVLDISNLSDLKNLSDDQINKYKDQLNEKFHFKQNPMRHQLVALIAGLLRTSLGIFFDIGTGKTLTSLYLSKYIWQSKRVLVICPRAVFDDWHSQCAEFLGENFRYISGNRTERIQTLRGCTEKFVGLSYSMVFNTFCDEPNILNTDLLSECGFDTIIIDESHRIKSPSAKRSRAVRLLASEMEHRVLLSGTPITESLLDLWSQIACLDDGERLGTNYFHFRAKFFHESYYKWKPKRGSESEIMDRISDIVISYAQDECFDLPDIIYKQVTADMGTEQREAYNDAMQWFIQHKHKKQKISTILEQIAKLRQIASGFVYSGNKIKEFGTPKTKLLVRLVDMLSRRKGKILIYYNYVAEREMILRCLSKIKIPVVALDSSDEILKYLESKTAKKEIVVVNPAVFGEGINFHCSNTVIFYSNNFSGGMRRQSIGRVHRKGQTEPCLIIDILSADSIDSRILEVVRQKTVTQREFAEYFIQEIESPPVYPK